MRISSDLLPSLALVVGIADRDGNESSLQVPPLLSPVLEVPLVLRDLATSTIAIQRQSFVGSGTLTRGASAPGTSQDVVIFGRGVWRVELSYHFLSNFTAMADTEALVRLQDPDGTLWELLHAFPVTNVPQHQRRHFTFAIERDSWILQNVVPGTGVGQALDSWVRVLAIRLL